MIYRHTFILFKVVCFILGHMNIKQLSPVNATADGTEVRIQDNDNKQVYILSMNLVKSEVKINKLMFSDVVRDWGA